MLEVFKEKNPPLHKHLRIVVQGLFMIQTCRRRASLLFLPFLSTSNVSENLTLCLSHVKLSTRMSSYSVMRRAIRFLILTVILSSVLPPLIYHREVIQAYFGWSPLPPLYEKYRKRKQHLEHHSEYEQRSDVKYIWQDNHQHSPHRLFPSIDHVFTLHRRGVGECDVRRYYECADCARRGLLVSP